MQDLLAEYSKLRLERELFPHIPILGITFDVNDLGLFCGMAYVLLLLLLLFSLMREHEHLHLALFKVRRLHDDSRNRGGGESRANYLYHALAMSQVLNSPPTLASWKPSRFKTVTLSLIFFLPVAMELFIVVVDWSTLREVSKSLDIKASIIYLEWFFVVFNSLL